MVPITMSGRGRRKNRPVRNSLSPALQDHIEVVEAGYEYMLAYAAQGKETDLSPDGAPGEVRQTLQGLDVAMQQIALLLASLDMEFAAVITDDIRKARAAVTLVLAQSAISSELIDNLNASIHLRAVLTDLFLLDEVQTI